MQCININGGVSRNEGDLHGREQEFAKGALGASVPFSGACVGSMRAGVVAAGMTKIVADWVWARVGIEEPVNLGLAVLAGFCHENCSSRRRGRPFCRRHKQEGPAR